MKGGQFMGPDKSRRLIENFFKINSDDELNVYLKRKFSKNKKLYKYCPVTDEENIENNYSVKNLIKFQVWLSEPKEFNDPFDSSIGLSEQFIYNLMMSGILNQEYLDKSNEEVKKITKDDLSTYTKFKETIDKMDKSFLKDFFGYYAKSEERYILLVKLKNSDDNKEIICNLFTDRDFTRKFFSNLINNKMMNENNINNIVNLLNDENVRKLTNSEKMAREITLDKREGLLDWDSMYEMAESFNIDKSIIDNAIDKSRDALVLLAKKSASFINDSFGMSCLSEKSDNGLMWGHYATKHRGFCIEYDIDKLIETNLKAASYIFPVIYTKTRPIIDRNIIESIEIVDKKVVPSESVNESLTKALLSKSKIWKYEKEWRIITPVKNNNREYSFDCVSAIYLGVNASQKLKDYMQHFCDKSDILLKQYKLNIEDYSINF